MPTKYQKDMTDHDGNDGTTWNSDDSSDTEASDRDEDEIISDEWLEFRLKMRDLFPHKPPPFSFTLLRSPTETQMMTSSYFWFSIAEEFIKHHDIDRNTTKADVALQLQYYYDLE